jgi:hypothetical protein
MPVYGLILKWTIFSLKTLRDLSVAWPDIALMLLIAKAASTASFPSLSTWAWGIFSGLGFG